MCGGRGPVAKDYLMASSSKGVFNRRFVLESDGPVQSMVGRIVVVRMLAQKSEHVQYSVAIDPNSQVESLGCMDSDVIERPRAPPPPLPSSPESPKKDLHTHGEHHLAGFGCFTVPVHRIACIYRYTLPYEYAQILGCC